MSLITADTVTEEVKGFGKDSSVVVGGGGLPGPCELDTLDLWVYPDPSGGLHRKPVDIRFSLIKERNRWRLKATQPGRLHGDPVRMSRTGVIVYEERTPAAVRWRQEEFYD